MKRQIRIIFLILAVGALSFLASCSQSTPAFVYEKEINLDDRNLIRMQLERVRQVQFIIPQDQLAADLLCVSLQGQTSYDVGTHPENGPVCFNPPQVSLQGGDNFCKLIYGPKYHATRITDAHKVYCAITGKRI